MPDLRDLPRAIPYPTFSFPEQGVRIRSAIGASEQAEAPATEEEQKDNTFRALKQPHRFPNDLLLRARDTEEDKKTTYLRASEAREIRETDTVLW